MITFILELKILLKIKENCVYHADFENLKFQYLWNGLKLSYKILVFYYV